MLRVLSAGCFVFASILAWVMVLSWTGWIETGPPLVIGASFMILFFVLLPIALWLFNRKPVMLSGDPEEHRRQLEEADLLEYTNFSATRSFQVEEAEDEGLHYFLDLREGGVLYMSGQYLYDFEEITDDDDLAQPRLFPCSDFTVVRHRLDRYVVDIHCRGDVLEPEAVYPPFTQKAWREVPDDGAVITGDTFEDLKNRYASPERRGR